MFFRFVATTLLTFAGHFVLATSAQGEEQPLAHTQQTKDPRVTATSLRLDEPRILPLTQDQWSADQRRLLEPFRRTGRLYNVFLTFAQHPTLFEKFLGFGGYVLNGSTLPARDREILILRAGWLSQAEYEWAQHARIGKSVGLTDDDLARIAAGPSDDAANDSSVDFDNTLLRAADEIHRSSFISDATWNALAKRYDTNQLIDVTLTVGQYQLVSMALNSFGVQLDRDLEHRLPTTAPRPTPVGRAAAPMLTVPRVAALADNELDADGLELLAEVQSADGAVFNIYRTFVRNPKMFVPRLVLGRYLQRNSTLPPEDRELAVLRTAWLCGAEYEWGHHCRLAEDAGLSAEQCDRVALDPESSTWNPHERALLCAADELHQDAFVTDETWSVLADSYSTVQLMDLVFTVGWYRMLAGTLNSLGVELEPGYPGLPD